MRVKPLLSRPWGGCRWLSRCRGVAVSSRLSKRRLHFAHCCGDLSRRPAELVMLGRDSPVVAFPRDASSDPVSRHGALKALASPYQYVTVAH